MTGFVEHYRRYISHIVRDVLPEVGQFLTVMAFAFAPPYVVVAIVAYSTNLLEFFDLAFISSGTIGLVAWLALVAVPVLSWLDEREESKEAGAS